MLTIQGLSALTCIDSIDKVNSHQESDKLIFGDTFGNVMTLEIDLNHMSYNNTKPDLVDSHKRVLDLDDFRDVYVKKKVHDQAVMKVFNIIQSIVIKSLSNLLFNFQDKIYSRDIEFRKLFDM